MRDLQGIEEHTPVRDGRHRRVAVHPGHGRDRTRLGLEVELADEGQELCPLPCGLHRRLRPVRIVAERNCESAGRPNRPSTLAVRQRDCHKVWGDDLGPTGLERRHATRIREEVSGLGRRLADVYGLMARGEDVEAELSRYLRLEGG